jgi:hypothetical protein
MRRKHKYGAVDSVFYDYGKHTNNAAIDLHTMLSCSRHVVLGYAACRQAISVGVQFRASYVFIYF